MVFLHSCGQYDKGSTISKLELLSRNLRALLVKEEKLLYFAKENRNNPYSNTASLRFELVNWVIFISLYLVP